MASQTNSYAFGIQTPPSPSATPRRGWWSRPLSTVPTDREATTTEEWTCYGPCCGGVLTAIFVFIILRFMDLTDPTYAKFSIQSIAVSPQAATTTWHVDFLVKNPSSRFDIYYDGDDVTVRLGAVNAAVLNITHRPDSKHHTAFSLVFVAEEGGNGTDVVSKQLDVKLRGMHKRHLGYDAAGHFDITCPNLTRSSEKIACQSWFTYLERFQNIYS